MPITSKYYTVGASLPDIAKELLTHTALTKTGCMEWQGALRKGYGRIKIKNTDLAVHKFIYEQLVGPASQTDYICHTCDNPKCINPQHLFKGSVTDNNRDKVQKGRMRRNGKPQMTDTDKVLLLDLAAAGVPYKEIADIFGNSQQWVAKVARDNGIHRGLGSGGRIYI